MDIGLRTYLLLPVLLTIHEARVRSVTVEADLGGAVILPCSTPDKTSVFWRHYSGKTVIDIIDDKEDFHDQDADFRGRVSGFPSEFAKGNYSIRLRGVKLADSGAYSCQIPNSDTVSVELKVKERSISEPNTGPTGGCVMRRAEETSLFLIAYVLLRSVAV